MLGYGLISEQDKEGHELKGTLAWMLKDPAKAPLQRLFDAQGAPFVREDVWVENAGLWPSTNRGPLTLGYGCNPNNFGPEAGFGLVLGDLFENQVLIIKTAWGGRSLYKDFRPPSSGGKVGPTYLQMIEAVKTVLANLKHEFPGYDEGGYELSGFVWWHGWNDYIDANNHEYEPGPGEYEQNLLNLIRDLRKDLNAPRLPIVIGEFTANFGKTSQEVHPNAVTIRKAQASVAARPEFEVPALPSDRRCGRPERGIARAVGAASRVPQRGNLLPGGRGLRQRDESAADPRRRGQDSAARTAGRRPRPWAGIAGMC